MTEHAPTAALLASPPPLQREGMAHSSGRPSDYRNASGRPLASADWLEAHHRAKLPERTRFAQRLARLAPSRVIDLGCATGLWFELLDAVLPSSCEFVGFDTDATALALARQRAKRWTRATCFEELDLDRDRYAIPPADLTLAFNVMGYLTDPGSLLEALFRRRAPGIVSIRQYDGAALRLGPMDHDDRVAVDGSLRAAVAASRQFHHYDMDRVFDAVQMSPYATKTVGFEPFERVTPFPGEFIDYYEGTLQWTEGLLSDAAADLLRSWRARPLGGRYFVELDLVALLS